MATRNRRLGMSRRSTIVPLKGQVLAVFDPDVLADRITAPRKWMRERGALLAELARGRLLAIEVGKIPFVEVRLVREAAETALPTSILRVTSGSVYAGDVSELPSQAWQRRRWNLWDWSFAIFLGSLPLILGWFFGFDARVLSIAALTAALFVLLLVPISWIVFRGGWGFARRSGVPPRDRPDQVLTLEAGTYGVAVRRDPSGRRAVELHLWPTDAAPVESALPRVSFNG